MPSKNKTEATSQPKTYFHGTSALAWQSHNKHHALYVATTEANAADYAFESAARDQTNGHPARPWVVEIPHKLVAHLQFEADNPSENPQIQTWQDSSKNYGSFQILGITKALKKKFKVRKCTTTKQNAN